MSTFIVDFELTGDVEVKARTRENAIEKVADMNYNELIEYIQHLNAGKHYADKILMGDVNGNTTRKDARQGIRPRS